MKRKLKVFLITVIATVFLAGCNAKSHTVEFYANNLGEFYLAVTVEHNEKVSRPKLPEAPLNFTFEDWFGDQEYAEKFDFSKPIKKDTQVFAKWKENRPYVADERIFHVVGELNHPESDFVNWNTSGTAGVDWDERSYLTKDEHTNLYSIELPIGELGAFKVKVAGVDWGSDLEFNYGNIDPSDYNEHIEGGEHSNIIALTEGVYKIEVESTFEWARVTLLSD